MGVNFTGLGAYRKSETPEHPVFEKPRIYRKGGAWWVELTHNGQRKEAYCGKLLYAFHFAKIARKIKG